jgi:hypothetical protein
MFDLLKNLFVGKKEKMVKRSFKLKPSRHSPYMFNDKSLKDYSPLIYNMCLEYLGDCYDDYMYCFIDGINIVVVNNDETETVFSPTSQHFQLAEMPLDVEIESYDEVGSVCEVDLGESVRQEGTKIDFDSSRDSYDCGSHECDLGDSNECDCDGDCCGCD